MKFTLFTAAAMLAVSVSALDLTTEASDWKDVCKKGFEEAQKIVAEEVGEGSDMEKLIKMRLALLDGKGSGDADRDNLERGNLKCLRKRR